ncbi:MAG TPA: SCO family protein [Myxococcota bacterium]|nr:SCO family protein [Myxococcota bacterium]
MDAQSVDARFIAPAPTPTSHAVLPSTTQTRGTLYDLELTLEDHNARPIPLSSFAGQPLIVSMFYAKCGYACPTLVQDLLNLENQLTEAERKSTRVLLVTFDPESDTPSVLASLAERHGVDTTRWTFARTNPSLGDEPTRELAGALGIKYRRLDDGHYNHSTLITLLDRRGVPLARIDGLRQDSTAFRAIVTHAVSETP